MVHLIVCPPLLLVVVPQIADCFIICTQIGRNGEKISKEIRKELIFFQYIFFVVVINQKPRKPKSNKTESFENYVILI